MTKPKISIVVAITAKDRAIGNKGDLVVVIQDDMIQRFKAYKTRFVRKLPTSEQRRDVVTSLNEMKICSK